MNYNFENKVAFVTGAGSGIGESTAAKVPADYSHKQERALPWLIFILNLSNALRMH